MRRIAGGMVAENKRDLLVSGVSARIVSTSSWKPMLSISSASSSTRNRSSLEIEGLALQVVDYPAGRADDDVRAPAQPGQLNGITLPAVDRQDVHAGQVVGVAPDRLGHLQRQLAGRREHERLDTALVEVELATGSAGRTRPSCRCRSGPARPRAARPAAAGSSPPGWRTDIRSRRRPAPCSTRSSRPSSANDVLGHFFGCCHRPLSVSRSFRHVVQKSQYITRIDTSYTPLYLMLSC